MLIPTYADASARVTDEKEDPLDLFISEHEPCGKSEEKQFRRDLEKLIAFIESDIESRIYEEIGLGESTITGFLCGAIFTTAIWLFLAFV